jgi:DNA modification methylase
VAPEWEVLDGDCVELMRAMPGASIEAVICDPPYGLSEEPDVAEVLRHWLAGDDYQHRGGGFMGRTWDSFVPGPVYWREVLRVLKPGGHLVAFGGTRTYDLLVIAIRLAGFEVRDQVAWFYAQGFPKSRDVSKAIDKAAGAEREVVGRRTDGRYAYGFEGTANRPTGGAVGTADADRIGGFVSDKAAVTAPATTDAERWQGWGTALKPAHEPIVVARKPLIGTVAGNVLAHGTGALNIDGCRIEGAPELRGRDAPGNLPNGNGMTHGAMERAPYEVPSGRWPANVVLSHSEGCRLVGSRPVGSNGHFPAARGASGYGSAVEDSSGGGLRGQDGLVERHLRGEFQEVWECVSGCPVGLLDEQSGTLQSGEGNVRQASGADRNGNTSAAYGAESRPAGSEMVSYGDRGGASRFFYCAKASTAERNAGLRDFDPEHVVTLEGGDVGGTPQSRQAPKRNRHPTVKPIELMRWLVRLVTPPGGVVLDPFCGSGSTGCAAVLEGFRFVGMERGDPPGDPTFANIARRVRSAQRPVRERCSDSRLTARRWVATVVDGDSVPEVGRCGLHG